MKKYALVLFLVGFSYGQACNGMWYEMGLRTPGHRPDHLLSVSTAVVASVCGYLLGHYEPKMISGYNKLHKDISKWCKHRKKRIRGWMYDIVHAECRRCNCSRQVPAPAVSAGDNRRH